MPIPDFQSIMLPLLRAMEDEQEHSIHEVTANLGEYFCLTNQELNELLPSGKQAKFYNRVGWARTYLVKTGLLEISKRSYIQITSRGKEVLSSNPVRIDMKYLERYPEYHEFRNGSRDAHQEPPKYTDGTVQKTPEEVLDEAYQLIRESLAHELLTQVKNNPPAFFERLVVEVLVKMGYGGSRQEAGRAVGQTGDEGIDGIIDEDRLGLDTIYIQAKRWETVVGRPEIQKFVGALMGKRARKGIFITTSSFSAEAIAYAAGIDFKVVLVDGKRLAEFMMDYDVGVTEAATYQLKRIDSDYFLNE
jgi:restriction system protein